MSWKSILKDDEARSSVIGKYMEDMAELHIKMLKLWSELNNDMPEEDVVIFESELENIGQALLDIGTTTGELMVRHNSTLQPIKFQEDKA